MTYPDLSSVNATTDLTKLLLYANTITNGYFMPLVVLAFWLIIFLGTFMIYYRTTAIARVAPSFTAASFATFGFSVIMASENGLLNYIYVIILLFLTIIGVIWLWWESKDSPY